MKLTYILGTLALVTGIGLVNLEARADERSFGYVYEPDVLPKGGFEFEQWLTGKFGHSDEDFAKWEFREEFELGLTEKLTTALYLNFEDIFSSPHDAESEVESENGGMDFTGISSEWKYQFVNPYKNPVGVVAYLEATTDGAHESELEEKLIFGTIGDVWSSALNLSAEQEWEKEDGETEKESVLEATAGISRKIDTNKSVGLEVLHARGYLDHSFNNEEYAATYVGPNFHVAYTKWWWTLTVMPQVYGNGDDADGNLQLTHRERLETRLVAGINF